MRVFLTGASGYLGSRIAHRLREDGHVVVALVRRAGAAPAGVEELAGDLAHPEAFLPALDSADALIHAAFDHADDFARAAAVERAAVDAMLERMAGSGRVVVLTSAAGVLGDTGPIPAGEDAAPSAAFPAGIRGFVEDRARATRGLRVSAMRLPVLVHGHGGSVFAPMLVAAARRDGISRHVGDGQNRLAAVHVDDAADAYVRALRAGSSGRVWNVAAETVTARALAEAVAVAAGGVRVEGVALAEAQAALHPFAALLLSMTFDLDATRTHMDLDWRPSGPSILIDVARGSYAASPVQRRASAGARS